MIMPLDHTVNLTHAKTGASVPTRHLGCDATVCDAGINVVVPTDAVLNRKITQSTGNIAQDPAITREQVEAVMNGIRDRDMGTC